MRFYIRKNIRKVSSRFISKWYTFTKADLAEEVLLIMESAFDCVQSIFLWLDFLLGSNNGANYSHG